ncbi:MAG: hypothetical protein HMLKMBBP_02865 [Planctomycetes bacterium]|nr:hypothetical protein [Planctomycetota bacterium]
MRSAIAAGSPSFGVFSSRIFFIASLWAALRTSFVPGVRCTSSSHAAYFDSIEERSAASSARPANGTLVFPPSRTSSSWAAQSFRISAWAISRASTMSASGISFADASTIVMAFDVPTTTRSSWLVFRWVSVGFTTHAPSTRPMRTAPTGPFQGSDDTARAAEAAFTARTSWSNSWSDDSAIAWICTSRL